MATVSMSTNSTKHGALYPGWNQQEAASPHVLGDNSGAVRQTSFSAVANPTSDLLIGDAVTTDGPFDSIGTVLEATLVGDAVQTSTYDIDSKFLPNRDFPSVIAGHEEAVLDLFQRMYGAGGVTLPWKSTGLTHVYAPLRGYSQGFTVDGLNQPYYQSSWGNTVTVDGSPNASWFMGLNPVVPQTFIRLAQGVYCRGARPMHSPLVNGSTNVNYQALRVRLINSSSITTKINFQWAGLPETAIICSINRTTGTSGTIGIDGVYRQFGAGTTTTITPATVATTGLDLSKEICYVLQWGFLTSAENATLRIKMYAFDPDSPPGGAPSVVQTTDLTNAARSGLTGNGSEIRRTVGGAVGFRDVILSQTDNSWPVHYPVITEPALIGNDFTKSDIAVAAALPNLAMRQPVHAWSGSGLDYLKMLCTARNLQMRVEGGILMFHDLTPIGSVQPLAHAADRPVLSMSAGGRARSIDAIAHRSISSFAFTNINYTDDSVGVTLRVNEETQTRFALPRGEANMSMVKVQVTDNDGVPIPWIDMWNAGARFRPSVDRNGNLTIVFRGPRQEYTTTGVGPWRIGYLEVGTQGFWEDDESITLYTGAPDSMVTRDKGGNVDNPFLNSQADVFDRGSWLISREGSPQLTLKFSVSAAARSLYQVGQIVSYGWAHYRVMEVEHNSTTSNITCTWFTTQAQQSANWTGQTATQYATHWSGKRAYDVYLRPLSSPVPVSNPAPFIRAYPSETQRTK